MKAEKGCLVITTTGKVYSLLYYNVMPKGQVTSVIVVYEPSPSGALRIPIEKVLLIAKPKQDA